MCPIAWDENFNTGIEPIDLQHRQLVGVINILEKVIHGNVASEEQRSEMLNQVMTELIRYAREHFHYEEVLMKAASYPRFIEHKHTHDEMARKIEDYAIRLKQGSLDTNHLYNLLSTWLTNHIQESDQGYVAYVDSSVQRQKQIQENEEHAAEVERLRNKEAKDS